MCRRIGSLTALLGTALLCSHAAAQPKAPKKKDDPPAGYKKDNLRGFTLYFSDEVLDEDRKSKVERKPLEALERELIIVETVLPADKVKAMKAVPIWVEWDERIAMANGRAGGAVAVFYGGHQSNLLGGDKSPLKSNSVTILSLRSLTMEHQPKTDSGRCVTLHELAHAFHHRVVGNDNPLVKTAFRQAMERKLYDPALYAATNDHEYFAELTCAYLDRLDYFPRTRDELKKHDAKGYELMEKLWGRPPVRKDAVVAKGPKLPSPDGDGKFSLKGTLADAQFGGKLFGELPAAPERKGRPLLVVMLPAASGKALAQLPRVDAWQAELQDFGMVTVVVDTGRADAEQVGRIARQRGLTLPWVDDFDLGIADTFRLPHALLFDHQGKCLFRGEPLDAELYVRIATGRALLAKFGKSTVTKQTQTVVDLLERGAPMTQVFAKLGEQLRGTSSKDAISELKELQTVLTDGGQKALDAGVELAKSDPIAAFLATERLVPAYRGTALEKPTFAFVNKMKATVKVENELRARPSLLAIKKIDTQLAGRDLSFDPRLLEFKEDNAALLKQLQDAVEKMIKAYPNARATEDARLIAERWDVKLKS